MADEKPLTRQEKRVLAREQRRAAQRAATAALEEERRGQAERRQGHFTRIIDAPTTAIVVTVILAALGLIALSGTFMTLGRGLLLLAWAAVAIRMWGHPAPVYLSVLAVVGGAMGLLAFYVKPDSIPLNVGILVPKTEFAFSAGGPVPRIEIGESGNPFDPNTGNGQQLLGFLDRDQLKIELEDGHYKFSTRITDANGKVIAEIVKNEWQAAPPPGTWDRNYNNDTLEVKDDKGLIVLQVHALRDRVQVQGIWWTKSPMFPAPKRIRIYSLPVSKIIGGKGVQVGSQTFFNFMHGNDQEELTPYFLYPSQLHLGELVPNRKVRGILDL